MRTHYTLTVLALVLFTFVGCSDASNPVGPDADLRFTEGNRSIAKGETEWQASDGPTWGGNAEIIVAEGKFTFDSTTRNRTGSLKTDAVAPQLILFSVSQATGIEKSDSGFLEFLDGDAFAFSVDIQQVQHTGSGSVFFSGPISHPESVGASWFFARAVDENKMKAESFAYYLGDANDDPTEVDFTVVHIIDGSLTVFDPS